MPALAWASYNVKSGIEFNGAPCCGRDWARDPDSRFQGRSANALAELSPLAFQTLDSILNLTKKLDIYISCLLQPQQFDQSASFGVQVSVVPAAYPAFLPHRYSASLCAHLSSLQALLLPRRQFKHFLVAFTPQRSRQNISISLGSTSRNSALNAVSSSPCTYENAIFSQKVLVRNTGNMARFVF